MKKSEVVHDLTMFALDMCLTPEFQNGFSNNRQVGIRKLCSLYATLHESISNEPSLYNLQGVETDSSYER